MVMHHFPPIFPVFSAHAEVVPLRKGTAMTWFGILRARGGSSTAIPRQEQVAQVFSAHAEVVPLMMVAGRTLWRILRARGGSSSHLRFVFAVLPYSPRTRR